MFKNIVEKLTIRSINNGKRIKKYGAWGLFIFAAILVSNFIAAVIIVSLSYGVVWIVR